MIDAKTNSFCFAASAARSGGLMVDAEPGEVEYAKGAVAPVSRLPTATPPHGTGSRRPAGAKARNGVQRDRYGP